MVEHIQTVAVVTIKLGSVLDESLECLYHVELLQVVVLNVVNHDRASVVTLGLYLLVRVTFVFFVSIILDL